MYFSFIPEMLAMIWGRRTVKTGAEFKISYSLPSMAWAAWVRRSEIFSATLTVIDRADLKEITWAIFTIELLIIYNKNILHIQNNSKSELSGYIIYILRILNNNKGTNDTLLCVTSDINQNTYTNIDKFTSGFPFFISKNNFTKVYIFLYKIILGM